MIEINDEYMTLAADDKVIATALFRKHAVGDGNGAWIVSTCLARLLDRNQAITALTVAELLESGYPDAALIVVALRAELR
jgi:hypothetical protein